MGNIGICVTEEKHFDDNMQSLIFWNCSHLLCSVALVLNKATPHHLYDTSLGLPELNIRLQGLAFIPDYNSKCHLLTHSNFHGKGSRLFASWNAWTLGISYETSRNSVAIKISEKYELVYTVGAPTRYSGTAWSSERNKTESFWYLRGQSWRWPLLQSLQPFQFCRFQG